MTRDRLWNSNYIKVMFTNFALYFAFYLVTPLLPIYLSETFGATKDTIGLILSGYTVTALLVRPFSGFLADRFQRKTVLLVCLLFYFLLFFGYVVAGSLLLFAIVRTLHGGPFGATTVANSTMAIDVLPSSRRREGRLLRSATEGIFLSMAGYTIFLVWPTMTGYYLSAVLIGLGNGHIWPAFQNMIIGIASKNERGTANSTILTAWDLGMGIGILLGGVIAETVSYHGAFLSMVIMHLVGTIMYLFFTERRMKRL